MTDAAFLRARLEQLRDATRNDVPASAFWVGDKAAERLAKDNLRSGALAFQAAHNHAKKGLEAFDRGDLDYANAARREAETLLIAALARQVPAEGLKKLRTGAGRRARPSAGERDLRLARAVIEQKARGFTGVSARAEAFKSDPELAQLFADVKEDGVRKALRKGLRLLGKMS